jgi:hypothetical protein
MRKNGTRGKETSPPKAAAAPPIYPRKCLVNLATQRASFCNKANMTLGLGQTTLRSEYGFGGRIWQRIKRISLLTQTRWKHQADAGSYGSQSLLGKPSRQGDLCLCHHNLCVDQAEYRARLGYGRIIFMPDDYPEPSGGQGSYQVPAQLCPQLRRQMVVKQTA